MNFLKNILNIDRNNQVLKVYHESNKLLVPILLPAYLSKDSNSKMSKIVQTTNILNIGFHSYVSTSCVIGDYIKHKKYEFLARMLNLKSHKLATIGLVYYILKTN
tara:strand:+ start:81 stop:395 length:315 start_codon:yes stop_codon:yes gene_type:complete